MITWSTYFHFQNLWASTTVEATKKIEEATGGGKKKSSFSLVTSTRDWDPILSKRVRFKPDGFPRFEKPRFFFSGKKSHLKKNVRKGRRSWNARRRRVMPRHFLGPWISGRWSFWQCQKWDFPFGGTVDVLSHSDLPGTAEARKYDAGGKMRFARGAGLWDFLVPNVNDIGYLFCRVLSWFLAGGFLNSCVRCKNSPQNCRSSGTSDLVRAMDSLARGFGEKTHSHHFENLPYNRTKNCLIPGIKMHKSLRYQKAQQEMVDIQHFNQQEREDCQNCKTSLSYCRTSAVVSGKAIPTNCSQQKFTWCSFSTLIRLIITTLHTVIRRLHCLWIRVPFPRAVRCWLLKSPPTPFSTGEDMLSMIRELRQTLKLKVSQVICWFFKDGIYRCENRRGKSRFFPSFNHSIFGGEMCVEVLWKGTIFLSKSSEKNVPKSMKINLAVEVVWKFDSKIQHPADIGGHDLYTGTKRDRVPPTAWLAATSTSRHSRWSWNPLYRWRTLIGWKLCRFTCGERKLTSFGLFEANSL